MNKIVVIGSTNTDMVIKSGRLPTPGETILGGTFFMNQGGKGANQAVAAARLKGIVTFVTKLGNDMFGNESLDSFRKEGIDISQVVRDKKNPSGVALINVDDKGENCIVVAQGANGALSPSDISDEVFSGAGILLMQLEIPMETVEYAAVKAAAKGIGVILNPAPAARLSDKLCSCLMCITPNETEAELLTGIRVTDADTARNAASVLLQRGVKNVIITMGASGAFLMNGNVSEMIPGKAVKAVDTTAAGDVFNGALAAALSEKIDIRDAIARANRAAAISVTRMGAQASAPYHHEL